MYVTLHNLKLSSENVITNFAIILCVSHQMVDHAQSPITMYLLDGCLFVFMFSHTVTGFQFLCLLICLKHMFITCCRVLVYNHETVS